MDDSQKQQMVTEEIQNLRQMVDVAEQQKAKAAEAAAQADQSIERLKGLRDVLIEYAEAHGIPTDVEEQLPLEGLDA